MSRSLDANLLAAMNSGSFTTWFQLQLIGSDRTTVVFSTTDVLDFELDGLTCKVSFSDPTYYNDYYTFRLLRGITVNGVPNYVTSSCYWPLFDRHEKRIRTIEGHVFPNSSFTTPGDLTYSQVISAVCSNFGFSVVYANPAAAWLNYQFYPTGRTLVLNDAKQFFTILRQKYLVFATDYDQNRLLFYQATSTAPSYPSGYINVSPGRVTFPGHGAYKEKSFISRDENETVHTSGGSSRPIHNLGFLPSTASQPTRYWYIDTNDWIIQDVPPNLKYLDFDALNASFDILSIAMWPCKFREVFNKILSPSWQWQAKYLDIFANTEGGAIPSTIETAAPYTPVNVSNFDKNLNTTHNNLQAFADAVDELTAGPAIFAAAAMTSPADADLLPVVDSNTSTHLVRKFSWANLKARLKTYFDTIYAINSKGVTNGDSHDHVGGDGGQVNHTSLANIGSNTHAQIDSALIAASGALILPSGGTLTIAADAITVTNSFSRYALETEGGAATDNLTAISGGTSGHILVLRTVNAAHDVTIVKGSNIRLVTGNFVMVDMNQYIVLMALTATVWVELSRSNDT